jgi:ribosomal protein L27
MAHKKVSVVLRMVENQNQNVFRRKIFGGQAAIAGNIIVRQEVQNIIQVLMFTSVKITHYTQE